MSTCAECRFWNRNGDPWSMCGDESNDYEDRVTDKQKCLKVLHANRGSDGDPSAADAPAIVTDGSGYAAAFWTAPTFGCTSYAPKCRTCNEPATFAGHCDACREKHSALRRRAPAVGSVWRNKLYGHERTVTATDGTAVAWKDAGGFSDIWTIDKFLETHEFLR